jgi:hypothetical protein
MKHIAYVTALALTLNACAVSGSEDPFCEQQAPWRADNVEAVYAVRTAIDDAEYLRLQKQRAEQQLLGCRIALAMGKLVDSEARAEHKEQALMVLKKLKTQQYQQAYAAMKAAQEAAFRKQYREQHEQSHAWLLQRIKAQDPAIEAVRRREQYHAQQLKHMGALTRALKELECGLNLFCEYQKYREYLDEIRSQRS